MGAPVRVDRARGARGIVGGRREGRRLWVPHDGGIPGARARRSVRVKTSDVASLHNG